MNYNMAKPLLTNLYMRRLEERQKPVSIFMVIMMKTLLISIIFFFFSLFFIFSQDDSVLAETYGIYRLKNIETSITDQESLENAINWIYEFQFDAITLGKDIIIFGDYIEDNPIYNILYKNYESTVKLILGERHYSVVCSDFLGYYAGIERLYDFVIEVNIPYIFIIELLDNNHIVILINNLYVLYEKEKS